MRLRKPYRAEAAWLVLALAGIAAGLVPGTALARAAAGPPKAYSLFGAMQQPSHQKPQAIGSYAKGCLAGAVALPESGPTWQAMRLSRNRYWGHPALIAFIKRLSVEATRHGWKGIYVGDMSQPRGGPMTSGHQSHQMGLDVDIWMLPPRRLNLSPAARERISSISVRTEDQTRVNENWTRAHFEIIRAAAKDKAVDRIFVAAAVKIEMCKMAGRGNRKWLRKVRPLYGHNTHFHVRLKCPRGDRLCRKQRPTVAQLSKSVDGCDETLQWWVTDYLEQLRNPPPPQTRSKRTPRKKRARDYTMSDLPRQCATVLSSE